MKRVCGCDCLNRCGDDERVHKGTVRACDRMRNWRARPRIVGVRRDAEDANVLVVIYDKEPTDDDMRYLHDCDRWPAP